MEVVVIVRRNFIPEPQGYTVLVHIGEDRPDLIVVLQIDYKYYFATYDKADKNYYVQLLSSRDIFNSSVSIPIKAILYNFEKQNFEDVRIGHIVLESISSTLNYELLGTGLSSETDSKVWTENLLVKEISGPYQDNKLVDVIDLTQPVYYLATPSDNNAHDSQVLSIKWEYQYNSEESVSFKNSKRSVVIENGVKKCKLECKFHNKEDILDITLFAFYKTKSPKVSLKNPTTYKETLTESKLIWGSKVSTEFENKVIQICKELWGDDKKMEMANGLMAVMAVETGRTFKAHRIAGKPLKDPNSLTKDDFYTNDKKSSRAVGLIQFTQLALEQLGDFKKGSGFDKLHEVKLMYARMGEIKQLDKVKQYLAPAKNKIKSPEDIYLQVFAPIGVGKSDSFVLYKKGTPEYLQNKSLDDQGNKNGVIERKELLSRYYDFYNEGQNYKERGDSIVDNDDVEEESEFMAKGVITFHIYHDGKIEKHIPKIILDENKNKFSYVFHDTDEDSHEICTVESIFTDRRKNGIKISSIPPNFISTYEYPKGGNAQKAYVYKNQDICVSGTVYGYRKYPKGEGQVQLVRMKDLLNYSKSVVNVFYAFASTQRRYCNPEAYAGFIGALATLNRKDVQSTGMCFADATSYPSVSHPNGDSVDTTYYKTQDIEQQKVDAFIKFHFTKIYRGNTGWYSKLKGTLYASGHEDHLHAGEFDSSVIVIKNEK